MIEKLLGVFRCSWCGITIDGVDPETTERHLFCSPEHKQLWAENPFERYNEDFHYVPGEIVKCWRCENEYELRRCQQRYYSSGQQAFRVLAGREGYAYDCPGCGMEIHHNWERMS